MLGSGIIYWAQIDTMRQAGILNSFVENVQNKKELEDKKEV